MRMQCVVVLVLDDFDNALALYHSKDVRGLETIKIGASRHIVGFPGIGTG